MLPRTLRSGWLRGKFGEGAIVIGSLVFAPATFASFHLMKVEQVVGSLNGNPAAQAIQLQMRAPGQGVVSGTKVWAADATGSNRVLLLTLPTNVTNSASGARILLTTSAFTSAMQVSQPTFAPDFTLATPMPASYLAAGRVTFEDSLGSVGTPGTILWSLSWGGTAYTGSNTGSTTNDSNGNFGPPFASSLPGSGAQGIRFTGAATAPSTTNLADYALTANPATVTKNSGASFVLPLVLTSLETWRQTHFETTANSGDAADDFDFDKGWPGQFAGVRLRAESQAEQRRPSSPRGDQRRQFHDRVHPARGPIGYHLRGRDLRYVAGGELEPGRRYRQRKPTYVQRSR